MDSDPNRTALRESHRIQQLQLDSHVCLICGEPALKTVSVQFAQTHGIPRSLIERHHVVGRKRDAELMVNVCLTHHWLLTTGLLREGVDMQAERNVDVRIAQCLVAVAILLEMLAPALRRWADKLRKRSK
jgi:hypothetical protein